MISFTQSALGQHGTKDVLDKNNAVCQSLANGNLMVTATRLPTMPVMMRRRRGRRWWRRRGWRWRRRRRYEMPPVMMAVMMMVDGSTVHVSAWRSNGSSGDCNSRKCDDEFDLVHGVVPFYFRASPFSRLHRVRIDLSDFLTNHFQALLQPLSNRPFWYNIYVFGKTRNVDSEDSLRWADRR